MVDFVFNIRSELRDLKIFETENLIQKRKPIMSENQLAKGN